MWQTSLWRFQIWCLLCLLSAGSNITTPDDIEDACTHLDSGSPFAVFENPPHETSVHAFDGQSDTKWLDFSVKSRGLSVLEYRFDFKQLKRIINPRNEATDNNLTANSTNLTSLALKNISSTTQKLGTVNASDGTNSTSNATVVSKIKYEYYFKGENHTISAYSIISADDRERRDPKDWRLEGFSTNGSWVQIDSRRDEYFNLRSQTRMFFLNNSLHNMTFFKFRFTFTDIHDMLRENSIQVAEIVLYTGNCSHKMPDSETVVQESHGPNHAVLLIADGTVKTFGSGTFGQLGHGLAITQLDAARRIPGLNGVKRVVAGGHHTVVLMQDGRVKTFGHGHFGQLGHGYDFRLEEVTPPPNEHLSRPKTVLSKWRITGEQPAIGETPAGKIVDIAAGTYHTVLLTDKSTIYTFGLAAYGALMPAETLRELVHLDPSMFQVTFANTAPLPSGVSVEIEENDTQPVQTVASSTVIYQSKPTIVPGVSGVKSIDVGDMHTVVLFEDDSLKIFASMGITIPQFEDQEAMGLGAPNFPSNTLPYMQGDMANAQWEPFQEPLWDFNG